MLSRIETAWRNALARLSPGEWQARLLGLPLSQGTRSTPGLLVIVLRGLSRRQLEDAWSRGELPFLRALHHQQHYTLQDYHGGCPVVAENGQAELRFGRSAGAPGPVFVDAETRQVVDLRTSGGRTWCHARVTRGTEDLFADGGNWTPPRPKSDKADKANKAEEAAAASPAPSWRERWRLLAGPALDLQRGVPLVHVPLDLTTPQGATLPASWRLREINRVTRRLYLLAHRSVRRDYHIWIACEPAVAATQPFPPGLLSSLQATLGVAGRLRELSAHTATPERHPERVSFRVARAGAVAHLYASQPASDGEKRVWATRILRAGFAERVGWRTAGGEVAWLDTLTALPPAEDLEPRAPPAVSALHQAVERDLTALVGHDCAGDLVLFNWPPSAPEAWTTLTPALTGVALLPPRTRLPEGAHELLRPATLRAAALHALGRAPLPATTLHLPRVTRPHFRLVTYNVHGCLGMDGRISPARVARVLAPLDADIIALQELDHLRPRSGGTDQTALIAEELGLRHIFCPTLGGANPHYGHALLTRLPLSVRKVGLLPVAGTGKWNEPRGAVWAEVEALGRTLHIFATHLGITPADRAVQIQRLLGPEWLGALGPDDPVLLCGDFNLSPGGANYRRLAARLRDAQLLRQGRTALKTFSTWHPVARIDHVFVSPHLMVEDIVVPRTHLTRVTSDHFPLVADLAWTREED